MIICGHRGASLEAPENTLGAFAHAWDHGIRAFEFDVRLCADDCLVVIHDDKLDRTTDSSGVVANLTAKALAAVNAARVFPDWEACEGVPAARQVMERLRDADLLLIEVKKAGACEDYPAICDELGRLIREFDLGPRAVIASFDVECLRCARDQMPDQPRSLIASDTADMIDIALSFGCDWLMPHFKHWDADLTRQAHDHGFRIGCWTPNTEEEIRRVAEYGVDVLITDCPVKAQRVVQSV